MYNRNITVVVVEDNSYMEYPASFAAPKEYQIAGLCLLFGDFFALRLLGGGRAGHFNVKILHHIVYEAGTVEAVGAFAGRSVLGSDIFLGEIYDAVPYLNFFFAGSPCFSKGAFIGRLGKGTT